MPNWDDERTEDEPLSPEDLCRQAFSRCSNWPEDRTGQIGLAQGLKLASDRSGIAQEAIIAACRETSAFCPTDADLLKVANEMAAVAIEAEQHEKQVQQHAEWEIQYGKPKPFEQTGKCTCCGRDWNEIIKISDARKKALWHGLRAHFRPAEGNWPPYRDMAPVARELGYADYADAWERS